MKITRKMNIILELTREIVQKHYEEYLDALKETKISAFELDFVKKTTEELEVKYTPAQFKRTITQLLSYPFITELKDAYNNRFDFLSDMYDVDVMHKPASSDTAKSYRYLADKYIAVGKDPSPAYEFIYQGREHWLERLRAKREAESLAYSNRFICPDFNFEKSLGIFTPVFGASFSGQPYSLDIYEESLINGYTEEEYYMSAAYLASKQTEEERLAWEFDNIVTEAMCPAFPPVEKAAAEQTEPIAVISEAEQPATKAAESITDFPPYLTEADIAAFYESIEDSDILDAFDYSDFPHYLTDAELDLYCAIDYVLDAADQNINAVRHYYDNVSYYAHYEPDNFAKNYFLTIMRACYIILGGADNFPDFLTDKDKEAYYAVSYYTSGDNDFDEQSIIEIEAYLNSISEESAIESSDSGIIEAAEPVIEESVIEEAEEECFEEPTEDIEQPIESITEVILPETEEQPEPADIMPEAENISDNTEPDTKEDNSALQIKEEEHSLSTPAEAAVNVTPDVVNDDEIFELFLSEHNEFKDILDEINSNYSIIVYKANYILGHASEFRGKKYLRKSSTAFIEMFKEGLDKLVKYTKDTKESFIYTLKLGRLEKIDFFLKEFEDRAYQFRLGLDAITRAEAAYSGVTSFEFKAI